MTRIGAERVVLPDGERPATVVVDGGRVVAVEAYSTTADVLVPAGRALLPGLVDSHVHVNEPGRTEWEGFATATRAAAAGGVSTIVDMPLNSIPATVDVPSLEVKRAAADGQLAVDVAFWGGAVPGNAGDLRALHDAGVVGFKCFLLPSGVEEFPHLDAAGLEQAMAAVADFDGLLIAHAEDPHEIETAPPVHGRRYADFLASRPPAAEVRAVDTLVATMRRTGCRAHIVHVSGAETLPLIRAAKDEGLPLTAETCPHYLCLRAEDVPDGATEFKCCPPIRGDANREALWGGLLDGTLDLVVSDHSPCVPALKGGGDFGVAWGGIASLQLALPAVWTEARLRGVSLAQVVRWMAEAPARLVGLGDRGRIVPGARADLCVFAPDAAFQVDPMRLHHRSPVTPYAGRTLFGVVEQTWLAGDPIGAGDVRGALVVRGTSGPLSRGPSRPATARSPGWRRPW